MCGEDPRDPWWTPAPLAAGVDAAARALADAGYDVVPLGPESGTERLTVNARFDAELDADTFSTVPPAGTRITRVKSIWTVRTLAGMARTLLTPRKRLIARAERERLASP
jgi:hypothetical protein